MPGGLLSLTCLFGVARIVVLQRSPTSMSLVRSCLFLWNSIRACQWVVGRRTSGTTQFLALGAVIVKPCEGP